MCNDLLLHFQLLFCSNCQFLVDEIKSVKTEETLMDAGTQAQDPGAVKQPLRSFIYIMLTVISFLTQVSLAVEILSHVPLPLLDAG